MPYTKKKNQFFRQLHIIKRLYALESMKASLIALEYNVSTRTVSRDMQSISTVIPLQNRHGTWCIDTALLATHESPLNLTLLKSFAKNVDINISCFEFSNLDDAKVNFAIEYKQLPKHLGECIVTALQDEKVCTFMYVKPTSKSLRKVDPIKLYTENSRWYLVARDYKDDKIKTFLLSNIQNFKITYEDITLTQTMLDEAEVIKSVWSSGLSEKTLVKLYVKPEASPYIVDVKLHHTQEIMDRHYDGGLEVHCTITHKLEILPAIKSWLPYVHIIEPKWLWEDLMRDLEFYKDEDWKMDI